MTALYQNQGSDEKRTLDLRRVNQVQIGFGGLSKPGQSQEVDCIYFRKRKFPSE